MALFADATTDSTAGCPRGGSGMFFSDFNKQGVSFLSFFKKTILFFRGIKRVLPWAASLSGESTVPNGNQRLQKNGTFFVMREGGRPHYCRRK